MRTRWLLAYCILGGCFVLGDDNGEALRRAQIHLRAGSIKVSAQPQRQKRRETRRFLQQLLPRDYRWGPLAKAEQLLISYDKAKQQGVLKDLQEILVKHGGWLGGYLPDDSVLGIGNQAAAEAAKQVDGVLWVGDYLPEYKVSSEVHSMLDGYSDSLALAVSFPLLHSDVSREGPQLGAEYDPASAAAREWVSGLTSAGSRVTLSRKTPHLITVVANDSNSLEVAVGWLMRQPSVHWIAPWADAKLHNWQGTAVTQCATSAPTAPVLLSQDQGTHPIWGVGLTGSDQVIGGGDSGMDYNNCYFVDPKVNWTANLETDPKSGAISFNSTNHRKIRLYRALGNGIEPGGHGTHTMGSLLGSPLNTTDTYHVNFRGIAPDAKLAFNDLGSTSTEGIFTPQDLSTNYFGFAYDVGARVHSDSWGSSSTTYDYMASQVDLFTWQNQDFTSVFAAGNEGAVSVNNSQGATTVTSPATAKNCIAAGATEVAGQSFTSNPQYVTASMTLHQSVSGQEDDSIVESYLVMQAGFGGQISSLFGKRLGLSVATPRDGCSTLQNSANINGSVVLIERGTCYMSSKVANAQAAGAVIAMVYDNQINDYFLMLADGTSANSIGIPGLSVPRRIGQLLVSAAQSGGQLRVSFADATTAPQAWANLAPFSSKGPTPDGRVKPDLLAPGTLQSAYTDSRTGDTCSLQTMQGTSMATPLIAGSAALVRQYFLSGAYPTGRPTPENAFQPSGPLVKAVLIGGAAGLSGYEPDTGLPLAPPPSFRQGFGRALLSQSLPLQGSGPGWSMQLVDRANMSTGDSHQYCLNGTGGPLTVTLVWHDYPASLSAVKNLVNDLDLTVRAAGLNGFPLLGNGGDQGMTGADRTNNVEQVSLSNLPPGEIAIQVSAHQVFSAQGPQPYSLVVLGKFSGVLASPDNPVNGGNATSGACSIMVAQIVEGPAGLTNQTEISFSFGLASWNNNGAAFECALSHPGGGTNSSAEFAACSSPAIYSNLTDGSYTFFVRAQGEDLGDSRAFFKDTTPPSLSFLNDLPAPSTAATTANFSFNATDWSAVSFRCMLSIASPSEMQGNVSMLQINGPILRSQAEMGAWDTCFSPLTFYWLLPGQWSLEITATDGAGNAATKNLEHSWSVEFSDDTAYARFVNASLGLTGSSNQTLQLQALHRSEQDLTIAESASFACQLVGGDKATAVAGNLTAAGQLVASADPSAWEPCSTTVSYDELSDGDWVVAARAANTTDADHFALTSFSVDTVLPTLQISDSPGPYVNTSTIEIHFLSNNSGVSFACLLLDSATDTGENGTSYQPCASPAEYHNLADGQYSFSVTAVDRVGNSAEPEDIDFVVDIHPPVFVDVKYPVAVQRGNITVSFGVSDEEGAGIAGVMCRFRPIQLVPDAANQSTAFTADWQNCTSPHTYYNLPDGQWGLTLKATDKSGLQQTTSEVALWVEDIPPVTAISSGPPQYREVPSHITFNFTSQSGSGIGTPIVSSSCRLVQISMETARAFSTSRNISNSPLPGAPMTSVSGAKGEVAGGPLSSSPIAGAPSWALYESVTLPADVLGNVTLPGDAATAPAPLAFALQTFSAQPESGWKPCSSPVIYQGLKSGNYSFQAAAVDAAGNQGQPTANYIFTVDQRVNPDGTKGAAFWGLGWKFWLIVGGAGGVLVVITAFCCCYCCYRKRMRSPMGAYVSHQNTVATPRNPRQAELFTPRVDRQGFDEEATAEALRRSISRHRSTPPSSPTRSRLSASPHESSLIANLEESQLRRALERSLLETQSSADSLSHAGHVVGAPSPLGSEGGSPGLLSTYSSGDVAEDRALLSARRSNDLHKSLLVSLQELSLRAKFGTRQQPLGGSNLSELGPAIEPDVSADQASGKPLGPGQS